MNRKAKVSTWRDKVKHKYLERERQRDAECVNRDKIERRKGVFLTDTGEDKFVCVEKNREKGVC